MSGKDPGQCTASVYMYIYIHTCTYALLSSNIKFPLRPLETENVPKRKLQFAEAPCAQPEPWIEVEIRALTMDRGGNQSMDRGGNQSPIRVHIVLCEIARRLAFV